MILVEFELNLCESKTHDFHKRTTYSVSSTSHRDGCQKQALLFFCLIHCLPICSCFFFPFRSSITAWLKRVRERGSPSRPSIATTARCPESPSCGLHDDSWGSPIFENKLTWLGRGPPYLFSHSPKGKVVAWQLQELLCAEKPTPRARLSRSGNLRTTQTSGKIPWVVTFDERTIQSRVPSPRDILQAAPLSFPCFTHKLGTPRNSRKYVEGVRPRSHLSQGRGSFRSQWPARQGRSCWPGHKSC